MNLNLNAILNSVKTGAKGATSTVIHAGKTYAPQIMVVTGVAGFGYSIYSGCKATVKAHDILEEQDATLQAMEQEKIGNPKYTAGMYERDRKNLNNKTRKKMVLAYLPTGTMALASGALVLGGFGILNGRYAGLGLAYKGLENRFGRYRGNVIDEFGEEVDRRMLYSIKHDEMQAALQEREDNKEIAADNKKKLIGKKRPHTRYSDIHSRLFDNQSCRWRRFWTPDQVIDYLRGKQDELNDKAQINHFLSENEVNDALGFPRTPEGQVVGWIFDKDHPWDGKKHFVSLGIDEMPEEELRRILATPRNEDIHVWVRTNPDGVVYRMIGKN